MSRGFIKNFSSLFIIAISISWLLVAFSAEPCPLEPPRSHIIQIPPRYEASFHEMIEYGDVLVTDRSYEDYMLFLRRMGFNPAYYRGKQVIDMGSGVSNFTAKLVEQGVDAKALDLIFLPNLGARIGKVRNTLLASFDRTSPLPYLPGGYEKFAWGIANARIVSEWIDSHPVFHRLRATNRLIGASATDLPFPDGSIDATVSFASVWGMSNEFYQRYLEELWRISRPGAEHFIIDGGRAAPILEKWGIPFRSMTLTHDVLSDFAIVMERPERDLVPHIHFIPASELPPWPDGLMIKAEKLPLLYHHMEMLRKL